MAFKWSCFVSYRVGKGALATDIVKDFYEKLSNEVELQSEGGIYLSQTKLDPGNVLDPTLAHELCQSACMIVLFTGTYFSKKHPYCTREYLAMRELETRRFEKLGVSVSKANGLIVPVVLRNLEQMPTEMKKRMWSDLRELQEGESGLARPKIYFEEIRKLAGYVAARYRELSALPDNELCNDFQFPDEEAALHFLSNMVVDQGTEATQ